MWYDKTGNHAHRLLPVVLRMQSLPYIAQTEAGRLLRVLFIRVGAVPADSGAWQGRGLLQLKLL